MLIPCVPDEDLSADEGVEIVVGFYLQAVLLAEFGVYVLAVVLVLCAMADHREPERTPPSEFWLAPVYQDEASASFKYPGGLGDGCSPHFGGCFVQRHGCDHEVEIPVRILDVVH